MKRRGSGWLFKLWVFLTFCAMIAVNVLAELLPINGVTTAQVADSYSNLFTPAGYAFSIWGLIYLLLAGHTLYQLGFFRESSVCGGQSLLHSVGLLFSLTCLLNAGWIVAWHYFQIPLTMLLMILLLLSLIYIRSLIGTQHLSSRERLLVRLPFSVYFGWITVATIANATVLLVSLDWHRFGLSEQLWTVIILIVGTLIGAAAAIRFQDVPYVLVLIWAYVGILVRHVSKHGLAGRYPAVMITASLCIALLAAVAAGLFFRSGERK